MSWLSKIVSDLAEKAAEKVADRVLSLLESEVTRYRNLEEEIERLRRISVRINTHLTDTDERCYIEDELVTYWLSELKSVSFDTDNLLDEYQTAINVHNYITHVAPSRKRKWYQIELPTIGPEWGPFQRRRFAYEIDKIDKRLDEIDKSWKNLRLKRKDGKGMRSFHLSASPFQIGPCHQASIVGRENDKNEIVDLLITAQTSTSSLGPKISVVPIIGGAGIGKTTLAQMVYDDPRLNCFNIKAWVCLSERCDVSTAMKKIYENMTGRKCDCGDFGRLQESLRDYLNTREDNKFLLVIDNFWDTGLDYWEHLRVPLLAGGEGSKVLITTRNQKACQMEGVILRPNLEGLDEENCWQLIQSLALPQGIINHDHEELLLIGKAIAIRCHGFPMAAKALGAVLNGRSDVEWSDVLSDMQPLKDDINEVVRASSKISYDNLKYDLKRCLAYCSIFPNSYVFERDQVIRYWMAEGLIQPDGRRRLEAVGTKYFDVLIWRSFFEKITIGTEGQNANCFSRQVERYRMTSLMLDLAMGVSKYESRRFESGKRLPEGSYRNSYQVRYASFLQRNDTNTVELECLEPCSNLRTLKFCHELNEGVFLLNSLPTSFFREFMHLRVLDMSNSDLKQVPDSIGELIRLRFLGLSNTKITTLPEKICNLFNLQTLELKGCLELEGLPEGLRRLINLRHLDLHLDWEEITDSTEVALPQGIGELEGLQTLSRFNVTSAKGQFCNIFELNNLNLRGDLCILNLEKVSSGHVEKANLRGKQFIENLMLRWNISALNDEQLQQQSEEVINLLMPNNRLRCLWIVNYPGTKFPDWMGDTSFSSLETIRISNCNNDSFLPLLGQLKWLKSLLIDNLPVDTMYMPRGFPSLKHLQLLRLSSLQRLYLENEIPTLKQIDVSDCPNLLVLVIHRHLYDILERKNFPNLRIMCVPLDSN